MLSLAGPEDLPALVALFDAGFDGYMRGMGRASAWDRSAWMRQAITDGTAFWIGERIGGVVMTRDGSTLKIDSITIDPSVQGRGHGIRALQTIEAHAQATGATEIALHTAQQFTRLVAFYSKAGYRVQAVGPHPKGRDDRLRVFLVKSLV